MYNKLQVGKNIKLSHIKKVGIISLKENIN
jgi:hypothetical protein